MSGYRTRWTMLVLTLALAAGAMVAMSHAALAQAQAEERPITLELRDLSIDDALKLIFKSTPYSYVLASNVTGRITLTLNNVTFTQALRAILDIQNLTYRREGNIYYITPKTEATTTQTPVIQEVPASQKKFYWFGPGGRYELQCLDARTITSWFGGWDAFMGIVPWAAEGQGGGGGGASGGGGGGGSAGGTGGGGGGGGGGNRGGGGGGAGGGGGGGGRGG